MKSHLFQPGLSLAAVQWRPLVAGCSVFLFIALFGYAAFSKLLVFQSFREQLEGSPFIGRFSELLSWLVPAGELLICLLMVFPFSRIYGVLVFTVMMAVFSVYIAFMLEFSADVPCICGGVISGLSWSQHLVFNVIFLLWGTVVLLFFKKELTS